MPPRASGESKANWNKQEVNALITFLNKHCASAEGARNFKAPIYNQLVTEVAPYLTSGPTKNATQCRTKWRAIQIKTIFSEIEKYQNLSGMHWDNENGAGINGMDAEAVWEADVKDHKALCPFKTSRWGYYI
ncbi:hypothetical protein PAXRUDRAFT_801372 [Paxillus rubicundulus Ve08.2h10]|uniref:Myb/SANT-like DNA-binding domain-containing protein n=1 Tax=Paxillus rubicundulus Ve08.2h10 TaxID=930991 RepID=A0A0D0DHZ2_9AGAM|nr:hypothetical protein PAXRUDRAFT_801372 [Paxillus rubicundulus Ve08.2h10]